MSRYGLLPRLAAMSAYWPGMAVAAETAAPTSSLGAMFQALLGFAVVLALMYAFFWLLRRYGPTQMAGQGAVKVVGGVMLGPRERLVVVEVQNTWLLVGVASGHVGLLHSLEKPADTQIPATPGLGSFADRLSDVLRRPGKG
jgi:flagellar protein FliO/FliZ